VEIAGPGFINLCIHPRRWVGVLTEILKQKGAYGNGTFGAGKKVQIEFVSANPTGPLHVGHGRGAAVGDTLARILKAAGFDVQREYYINDTGNQMNMLGLSVWCRYRELFDLNADFPENGYKGDYIRDLAGEMRAMHGDSLLALTQEEALAQCRAYAGETILSGIKDDLAAFNVSFDHWFNESRLYQENKLDETLGRLKAQDLVYDQEGALWFRSSRFGDEKDRVIRKQDGSLTYFAPDIAYHQDKLERGFAWIIDIWGADHHGYVARMRAAFSALGAPDDCFHALLIQLVALVRGGEPVQMSTRSGEFVTLKEILDEVGKDAARYFFMMRRCDSHLVFDLELAKKKGEENPVYYIQYAHARICSILRKAAEQNMVPDLNGADLALLAQGDDLEMVKLLASFPDIVTSAAADLEPHRIAFYLLELATAFHRFYNKNKVISEDHALTQARLILIDAIRQVIANALALMGITAPETM
jgi:arginyl-tRNA synthetase